MILLAFMAMGIAAVPILGGQFARLGSVRVREPWIIGAAFTVQFALVELLAGAPAWQTDTIHVGTYIVAFAFVWRNRRLRGLPTAFLGGACNFLAILANGGTMPAWPTALRLAGKVPDTTQYANSGVVRHAHLQILGDVIPVPYPRSIANVLSVGDLLLVTGVLLLIHTTCGSRLGRRGSASKTITSTASLLSTVTDSSSEQLSASPVRPTAERVLPTVPSEARMRSAAPWAPPLPPPPTTPATEYLAADGGRTRVLPIDLLPLAAPADGRALVDA